MLWSKLSSFIDEFTQEDDIHTTSNRIEAAQLAYDTIYDTITEFSQDYYIKTKTYTLSNTYKQSFDLEDDYVSDVDCDYVDNEDIIVIQRTGRANRYSKQMSSGASNWVDYYVNNKFSGTEIGYSIEIGKSGSDLQNKIVFYNSPLTQSINFNYFYEPTAIPDETTISDSTVIDIPRLAERHFKWLTLKNLKVSVNDIEQLMGVDFAQSERLLISKLKKTNKKFKKRFKEFKNQFKDSWF